MEKAKVEIDVLSIHKASYLSMKKSVYLFHCSPFNVKIELLKK